VKKYCYKRLIQTSFSNFAFIFPFPFHFLMAASNFNGVIFYVSMMYLTISAQVSQTLPLLPATSMGADDRDTASRGGALRG